MDYRSREIDDRRPLVAGVIGWPIAHSQSHVIHNFWMHCLGLDGHYVRLPVAPKNIGSALNALPLLGFRGVNLTLPYKEAGARLVGSIEPSAVSLGAINCVRIDADGALYGMNTDIEGFLEPLAGQVLKGSSVVVLGAGGAARAVVAALKQKEIGPITIVNRSLSRGKELLEHFDMEGVVAPWKFADRAIGEAEIVVNASSLGMQGQPELPLTLDHLRSDSLVYDIVYTPLETRLLSQARARGCRVIDGMSMLIGQAARAFTVFYGKSPPRDREIEQQLRTLLTK